MKMMRIRKKTGATLNVVIVLLAAILTFPLNCGKQDEKIKIGAILPLTGELAAHGEDAKRGIELAVTEINDTGGINGKSIEIVYEDDKMNPVSGLSAFKKLVDFDKVQVIIGGFSSSVALAIAPHANERKIVLFSPTASHPDLITEGGYIFRNWPSDNFDAKVIADYSYNDLKINRYAILYPNTDNGLSLSILFAKEIEAFGANVLFSQGYEPGTNDFRTIINKIKHLKPGALYIPGYYEDVGKFLVQSKQLGLKTRLLSSSAIESPNLLEIAGNAADGLIYSKTSIDTADLNYKLFYENFQNMFSASPGIAALQCYDAINIILSAIRQGTYKSTDIRDHLLEIKNYPGVTGLTTFDEKGDVIKEFSIFHIRNSKFIKYE